MSSEHPSAHLAAIYWRESARPLTSLVFVLPLLVVYEGGVLWMGPEAMRNGADVWLRQLLLVLGFGQYFLLPMLTCGILLGWHHVSRQPWRITPGVLSMMFVEATVLAIGLLLVARLQAELFGVLGISTAAAGPAGGTLASASPAPPGLLGRLAQFFGAGIYEELLFRLMLLPAAAGLGQLVGLRPRASWIAAVIVTSLLFSAAHYRVFIGHGDELALFSFAFRGVAGVVFCLLFLGRGFGIVAGTHALYDVLVGMF
jgi:membrane protease YdiL (CAAX protease family)